MRKAQAAAEFLTTYGIAILAVVVITGILTYFGYLNPNRYAPNECNLGKQVVCDDYILTTTNISITIRNTLKEDIKIIDANSSAIPLSGCALPIIPAGQRADIYCATTATKDELMNIDIAITYQRANGPEHTIRGTLKTTARSADDPLATCPDADNDGYKSKSCGGNDCNDFNANINPGAPDYCAGNKDEDCDGDSAFTEPGCTSCDNDGDGDQARACGGTDCDDDNEYIWHNNPNSYCDCVVTGDGIGKGVPETPSDGIDNDCDGIIDEGNVSVELLCNNLIDDDGDGCRDFTDSDCGGKETGNACSNATDEDCDKLVNCQDPDCQSVTPIMCLLCEDGIKTGGETDIDCGSYCAGCSDGKSCSTNADCKSYSCEAGLCVSCNDGIQNQGERGIDCGGPCTKQTCPAGSECTLGTECDGGVCCSDGTCAEIIKRKAACKT